MKHLSHRYINQITGLFILSAVLVVVALFIWEARGHKWFERTVRVTLMLPEEGSYGLKPGADVMVLGTEAGEIAAINISPDDRMVALMMIREDFTRFIGVDSRVTIKKILGLAGDAFVDISGKPGSPVKEETILAASIDRSINDMLQEVIVQIRTELLPAIKSIRLAAESHSKLTQAIEEPALKTINRLSSITQKIDFGTGFANRLLFDQKLAEDIHLAVANTGSLLDATKKTAAALESAADNVGGSAKQFGNALEDLPETVKHVNTALKDIQIISKNLIQMTGAVSETVENVNTQIASFTRVIVQTQITLREIQRLTEAMQRHWLIRDNIERDSLDDRISPKQITGSP